LQLPNFTNYTGQIAGLGTLTLNGSSAVPTPFDKFPAGPYDVGTVDFQQAAGTANTFRLQNGTYIFTGNVIFEATSGLTTIDNATNNPKLYCWRKYPALRTNSGSLIWTKGTGGITFSSKHGCADSQFPRKIRRNIISSNTSSGGLTFVSSFTTAQLSVNTTGLSSAATIYFAGNSNLYYFNFYSQRNIQQSRGPEINGQRAMVFGITRAKIQSAM